MSLPHIKSPVTMGALIGHLDKVFPDVFPQMAQEGRVWEFQSPESPPLSVSVSYFSTLARGERGEAWLNAFRLDCDRESIYRTYAQLINHGRPRKVAWRRLNRQQKERAIELARAGLL